jgi:hypothetical protein
MYWKWKNGPQDKFNVEEDVVLVEATDHFAAWRAGEAIARESEGDDQGSLTEYGQPANRVFAGLRKVVMIPEYSGFTRPGHGDEVTYSTFVVPDLEAVAALAAGEQVEVRYVETHAGYLREDFEAEFRNRNL